MKKELMKNIDAIYEDIKNILGQARHKAYYAVNNAMVQAYWEIGRLIVEEEQKGKERAVYGEYLLKNLAEKLSQDFGKGFDERELRRLRQFYMFFPIRDAVRPELSWTHYRLLLRVEKEKAREYYHTEAVNQNWSTRALERQINSFYYERLLSSHKKEPVKKEMLAKTRGLAVQTDDLIKDPYVLEFLNLHPDTSYLEKELEQGLIDKLQQFLLELGKGFCFVARQQKITTDTKHFYIDLVFYNNILKCFVLIDLKTNELTHQDIGQMDMYMRLYEDKIKAKDDNPTIGIILCAEKDETIVKYSVLKENKRIFASRYKLYLPSEEELKREIEREKAQIVLEHKLHAKT